MNLLDRRFLNISLSVLGIANEPADNPAIGSQYIVGSTPAGAFSQAPANSIARYNGTSWAFFTPKAGELEVFNLETGEVLSFNGSSWSAIFSLYEPISPVLAIVPTGLSLPASAVTGETFLNTADAKLYTATATNTWDSGTLTTNGSRYASSSDHKIYQSDGSALSASNILNGDIKRTLLFMLMTLLPLLSSRLTVLQLSSLLRLIFSRLLKFPLKVSRLHIL